MVFYSVGLQNQCVARNVAGFVALAQAWAGQPERLNQVRRRLQAAYFSKEGVARPDVAVKSTVYAMRQMWQRWCAGKVPATIRVDYEDIGLEPFVGMLEKTVTV